MHNLVELSFLRKTPELIYLRYWCAVWFIYPPNGTSNLAFLLPSGLSPKCMWGKCAQFLAAVLKASLWLISGLLAFILCISSLMNRLYAEGTRCLFSGGGIGVILGGWSGQSNASKLLRFDEDPQSFLASSNRGCCFCGSCTGRLWSKAPTFTDNKFAQCPHLTVTIAQILVLGTLTANMVVQKLQCT